VNKPRDEPEHKRFWRPVEAVFRHGNGGIDLVIHERLVVFGQIVRTMPMDDKPAAEPEATGAGTRSARADAPSSFPESFLCSTSLRPFLRPDPPVAEQHAADGQKPGAFWHHGTAELSPVSSAYKKSVASSSGHV
jgi:hypothetical protein